MTNFYHVKIHTNTKSFLRMKVNEIKEINDKKNPTNCKTDSSGIFLTYITIQSDSVAIN